MKIHPRRIFTGFRSSLAANQLFTKEQLLQTFSAYEEGTVHIRAEAGTQGIKDI